MRLGKFSLFFNTYLLPGSSETTAKPDLRSLYQLDIACHKEHVPDVEACVRKELNLPVEMMQAMFIIPEAQGDITQLRVRVLCLEAARDKLQQLIHRLGMDGAVRSIGWKVITEKLTAEGAQA